MKEQRAGKEQIEIIRMFVVAHELIILIAIESIINNQLGMFVPGSIQNNTKITEDYMMRVTDEELKKEAVRRMRLLRAPREAIEIFQSGDIPMTIFAGETQDGLTPLAFKVLTKMRKEWKDMLPFYITESWHVGGEVISVLFLENNKKEWKEERQAAKKGHAYVYAYNLQTGQSEIGDAFFSLEDGVLWRVA